MKSNWKEEEHKKNNKTTHTKHNRLRIEKQKRCCEETARSENSLRRNV